MNAEVPSVSLLDLLLRKTPVHVFWFDALLRCRYAAPMGEAFLGHSREQCVGLPVDEILPPAATELRTVLERAVREGHGWHRGEVRVMLPDAAGDLRCCWAVEVLPLAVGRREGVMISLADISGLVEERDRFREELDEQRKREDEHRRAMLELLADLRNLLTPPLGYLQLLTRRPWALRGLTPTAVISRYVLPRLADLSASLDRLRLAAEPASGARPGSRLPGPRGSDPAPTL